MPRKVLVVDDEDTSRKIAARAIERLGHVVVNASSAQRALDILQDNPDIALLVTDMSMPEMDGRELITSIRKHTKELKNPAVPIIIMSGVVGPKEIHDLLLEGASRFLPKPLDISMLQEYVQRLMA